MGRCGVILGTINFTGPPDSFPFPSLVPPCGKIARGQAEASKTYVYRLISSRAREPQGLQWRDLRRLVRKTMSAENRVRRQNVVTQVARSRDQALKFVNLDRVSEAGTLTMHRSISGFCHLAFDLLTIRRYQVANSKSECRAENLLISGCPARIDSAWKDKTFLSLVFLRRRCGWHEVG